jgi:hypothetical protein
MKTVLKTKRAKAVVAAGRKVARKAQPKVQPKVSKVSRKGTR